MWPNGQSSPHEWEHASPGDGLRRDRAAGDDETMRRAIRKGRSTDTGEDHLMTDTQNLSQSFDCSSRSSPWVNVGEKRPRSPLVPETSLVAGYPSHVLGWCGRWTLKPKAAVRCSGRRRVKMPRPRDGGPGHSGVRSLRSCQLTMPMVRTVLVVRTRVGRWIRGRRCR